MGDRVRAVNRHPAGHTREPRYVRGRSGVVHEHHGAHVLPDKSAEGIRVGRHLYTVQFTAADLFWHFDRVHLASPAVVAASAILGRIASPDDVPAAREAVLA